MTMNLKSVIGIIFSLDVLIVILHIVFGKDNAILNLDGENNLPATYSFLKLVVVGIIAFVIFFTNGNKCLRKWSKSLLWIPFGSLFIYLGFDELFTIHEKTIGYLEPSLLVGLGWFSNHVFYWVPLFLPLIILAIAMFYLLIKNLLEDFSLPRKLFIAGTVSFFMVIVSEFVGGFLEGGMGYAVMTLEESFEIFGASLFLVGLLVYRKQAERLIV